MLLYSKTIHSFIKTLKAHSREILSNEMGLSCRRERFEWKGHLYPIHIVVFEDTKKLGHFDWRTYQIGLNKSLMYTASPKVIKDILRHELAHFYAYLEYGHTVQDHGKEYRDVCRKFSWTEEVSSAKLSLDQANTNWPTPDQYLKISEKIKKLLKLAGSDNGHEAELATIKANELLLKYNLEQVQGQVDNDEEEVCVKRVLSQKRMNTRMNTLYDVLTHFYVQPVLNRGHGEVYLEVVGNRLNVDLADYTAKFLFGEFERMWKKAQKEDSTLKGITKKNSYLLGLAKGFIHQLQKSRQKVLKEERNGLILIQKDLQRQLALAYPRLSSSRSKQSKFCQDTATKGARDGQQITVNPGVSENKKAYLLNE